MTVELSDVLNDTEISLIMWHVKRSAARIRANTPKEILYDVSGEINLMTKPGAILYNLEVLSATLRNFGYAPALPETEDERDD